MHIEFIPIAEASVATLMQSINRVVLNPLILLLFSAALVYFLYGVVQYLLNPDDEELRTTSKSHMLWGVIGMFIMMSVFGIMRLILNSFGENRIRITDNGEISVSSKGYSDIGNPAGQTTLPGNDQQNSYGGDQLPSGVSNPFKGVYNSNDQCFRISTAIYGQNQLNVLNNVSPTAKKLYAEYFKIEDQSTIPSYIPIITTEKGVVQDQVNNSVSPIQYYHWFIAYAPAPNISTDCATDTMFEKDPTAVNDSNNSGGGSFVNTNPFKAADYMNTGTYYNETDFVVGDFNTDMSVAATSKVVEKIKKDISPRVYDPSMAKFKNQVVKDNTAKKAYYWSLVSYPKNGTGGDPFSGGANGGSSNTPNIVFPSTLTEADFPDIGKMQTKYVDTSKLYRVVASGMSNNPSTAQDIAVSNGKAMLASKSGKTTVTGVSTLESHVYRDADSIYHYWMAFSMSK